MQVKSYSYETYPRLSHISGQICMYSNRTFVCVCDRNKTEVKMSTKWRNVTQWNIHTIKSNADFKRMR